MAPSPDRQFILELVIRSANPALLEGLDVWLRLGLLSDETVRHICQEQLSCPLSQTVPLPVSAAEPQESSPEFADDFLPAAAPPLPIATRSPSPVARMMQSFMAELSVVWLLFLGVFLVVVSSGVLAATQWRNVSAVGQYLILLGYTLAFWVAGGLAKQRPNLRLTSRMLQIATVLIIPVNFWMIDGFKLLSYPTGLAIAAIAACLLSAITFWLLKPTAPSGWIVPMAIALNWLHWGWSWPGFSLIATYLGTVGATLALAAQERLAAVERTAVEGAAEGAAANRTGLASNPQPLTTPSISLLFGALLLVARAVFVAQVPVNRLGLAMGICGWLLVWLFRQRMGAQVWTIAGMGLLLLGWAVTVIATPPWQAIAISGLGLGLLANYLRRTGQGQYLSAGFLVGLQLVWLIWRVVPSGWQQGVIATCTRLAGSDAMPVALVGLGFFPYLLLTVALAVRLRRWQRPHLAQQAELLALGLGIILAGMSVGNPLVRFLNLTLSSLTLVTVIRQRSHPTAGLIYLTHGVGLAAIAAGIHAFLPNLDRTIWATILLAGMVAEWGFVGAKDWGLGAESEARGWALGASSVWYYGLALSALSYLLLQGKAWQADHAWGWLWLLTPPMLTWLGSRRHFQQHQLAGWLGVFSLVLVQLLMFESTAGRLTGMGVATLIMVQNTRQLKHLLAAGMTLGFGLGFVAIALWEIFGNQITFPLWLNLLAIAIFLLWCLRSSLVNRHATLALLYNMASDIWAIVLTGPTLLLLTITNLCIFLYAPGIHWHHISAAALLLCAISYRLWQSSFPGGLYLAAWSLELLVASSIALAGRSLDAVGIANLALGLATQFAGDWWLGRQGLERRSQESGVGSWESGVGSRELGVRSQESESTQTSVPSAPTPSPPPSPRLRVPASPLPRSSLHLIPLLYAFFGFLLQHRSFTAATGLYTLAAALVGLGVGRRLPAFKPLTLVSVLGVSLGAYELLVYQLSQAKGGSIGDGIVLLAVLGAALAIALRLFLPHLTAYLRLAPWELLAIAHLHWLFGTLFLIGALFNPLSPTGKWCWFGVAVILSSYALVMGRGLGDAETRRRGEISTSYPLLSTPLLWLYFGIFQSLLSVAYLLHLLIPETTLIDWGGAIAAVVGCFLYLASWPAWGWERMPWRRSATLLPAVVTMLTAGGTSLQGLLIAAAFYVWLAQVERQPRLSYGGILLADWAFLRFLYQNGAAEPLWLAAIFSASLLFVAQVDPALRSPTEREKRHWLRCLAVALVCLTAFYQAEVGINGVLPILTGILSIGFTLGFIIAGILLRVRAFLYIGTATFVIQVLRLLWRFISDYSLLLWAMGIFLGLAMIWVAATFEARRSQITTLLQHWANELEEWD